MKIRPVTIPEFVCVGAGVCRMPGVEIKKGAIIGMGSVVTRTVPPMAVVMGNSMKKLTRQTGVSKDG